MSALSLRPSGQYPSVLYVHQHAYSNSSLAVLQVPLANQYGSVTLYDDTMAENNARLPLGVFAVVDNEFNKRIVCVALLSDTNTSAFKWLLEKYTEARQGVPTVFLVDADSAMKGAASKVWPDTQQEPLRLAPSPEPTQEPELDSRQRHERKT